ncbi:hypothetical protein Q0F98_33595 [Paenibacillus amylolyticus]|nr:hypothetical protein Q0F98_33595 [Paenibacillus amylolyticus]
MEPKSVAVLIAEMNGDDLSTNQNILKIALMNVVEELVQNETQFGGWAEWFGNRRLIVVIVSDEQEGLDRELLMDLAKQMHMWIGGKLPPPVYVRDRTNRIGLGGDYSIL